MSRGLLKVVLSLVDNLQQQLVIGLPQLLIFFTWHPPSWTKLLLEVLQPLQCLWHAGFDLMVWKGMNMYCTTINPVISRLLLSCTQWLLVDGSSERTLVGEVLLQDSANCLSRSLMIGEALEHLPWSAKGTEPRALPRQIKHVEYCWIDLDSSTRSCLRCPPSAK